jgi:hypothetical protein
MRRAKDCAPPRTPFSACCFLPPLPIHHSSRPPLLLLGKVEHFCTIVWPPRFAPMVFNLGRECRSAYYRIAAPSSVFRDPQVVIQRSNNGPSSALMACKAYHCQLCATDPRASGSLWPAPV